MPTLGRHTDHLTKRLRYGSFVRHMLRPFKAETANSVIMDLRLPEGLAMLIDEYARGTGASRNETLAGLVLAGTKAYSQTDLSFHKALRASRAEPEPESSSEEPTDS